MKIPLTMLLIDYMYGSSLDMCRHLYIILCLLFNYYYFIIILYIQIIKLENWVHLPIFEIRNNLQFDTFSDALK